ncbi:prepilin peptidase [Blautia glucerasea]
MLTIAGTAVVMDISSMRISNGWILCSLLTGFLYSISGKGPCFREFAFGTLIPAAVLGGLCWFRMLGAGDIKLICSLGGIMGPEPVWRCMGISFFIGEFFHCCFLPYMETRQKGSGIWNLI